MSTVLRFCRYKQSATLSAWHPVLSSGETHCWGWGRTLPLRMITPNGRRRGNWLTACTHSTVYSTLLTLKLRLLYLPAPTLLCALPACTNTSVCSTCLHRHYCVLYLPVPTLVYTLPVCTDTTVFSTCTSEWSILSGLALQLTLLSALAAPGLTLQLTLLSTLPV